MGMEEKKGSKSRNVSRNIVHMLGPQLHIQNIKLSIERTFVLWPCGHVPMKGTSTHKSVNQKQENKIMQAYLFPMKSKLTSSFEWFSHPTSYYLLCFLFLDVRIYWRGGVAVLIPKRTGPFFFFFSIYWIFLWYVRTFYLPALL